MWATEDDPEPAAAEVRIPAPLKRFYLVHEVDPPKAVTGLNYVDVDVLLSESQRTMPFKASMFELENQRVRLITLACTAWKTRGAYVGLTLNIPKFPVPQGIMFLSDSKAKTPEYYTATFPRDTDDKGSSLFWVHDTEIVQSPLRVKFPDMTMTRILASGSAIGTGRQTYQIVPADSDFGEVIKYIIKNTKGKPPSVKLSSSLVDDGMCYTIPHVAMAGHSTNMVEWTKKLEKIFREDNFITDLSSISFSATPLGDDVNEKWQIWLKIRLVFAP
jgi:hypothetical protein